MQSSPAINHVLVLDANQRSSLAVIRALGSLLEVRVYTSDSSVSSIGGCSKYSHKYLQSPSIEEKPEAFLSWLENVVQREKIAIAFPCTEMSSQLLLMNPKVLGSAQMPFSSLQNVMQLANKGDLINMARNIGIAYPKSTHYQRASQVDCNEITDYPVVIKPNLSLLWRGDSWQHSMVNIARSKNELKEYLKTSSWLENDAFMLQEYIEGHGAGIFAIYDKGKPVSFFAHRRLREKPPSGGVSVLSTSRELDPLLLENAKKLLNAANWHGVAMVEYRISKEGTPYLMEVNTRFWGSLQLAIDSGVNFPELLYQITLNQAVKPVQTYKVNVRLRWLLGDLDSLYLVLRDSRFSFREKLTRFIVFFIPHLLTTHHQVARRGDWGPGIEEIKQYFASFVAKNK